MPTTRLAQMRADWQRTHNLAITADLNVCTKMDAMLALGLRPEDIPDPNEQKLYIVQHYEVACRFMDLIYDGLCPTRAARQCGLTWAQTKKILD